MPVVIHQTLLKTLHSVVSPISRGAREALPEVGVSLSPNCTNNLTSMYEVDIWLWTHGLGKHKRNERVRWVIEGVLGLWLAKHCQWQLASKSHAFLLWPPFLLFYLSWKNVSLIFIAPHERCARPMVNQDESDTSRWGKAWASNHNALLSFDNSMEPREWEISALYKPFHMLFLGSATPNIFAIARDAKLPEALAKVFASNV